jgi:hypothetical protein
VLLGALSGEHSLGVLAVGTAERASGTMYWTSAWRSTCNDMAHRGCPLDSDLVRGPYRSMPLLLSPLSTSAQVAGWRSRTFRCTLGVGVGGIYTVPPQHTCTSTSLASILFAMVKACTSSQLRTMIMQCKTLACAAGKVPGMPAPRQGAQQAANGATAMLFKPAFARGDPHPTAPAPDHAAEVPGLCAQSWQPPRKQAQGAQASHRAVPLAAGCS